jgi:hypothetical protein
MSEVSKHQQGDDLPSQQGDEQIPSNSRVMTYHQSRVMNLPSTSKSREVQNPSKSREVQTNE